MTILSAFTDGIRRVRRAPAVLLGVWLLAAVVSFPPVSLPGGVLDPRLWNSLEAAFLDGVHQPATIVHAAAARMVVWIFLTGGIIDRYARERATRARGFFGATGVFFFRFLRLAAIMAIVYGILFGFVHPWLARRSLYAVFGALVAACNLIFDYAQVRAVVEDRRSMIGALGASIGFIRNAPAAIALYLIEVAIVLLLVAGFGQLYAWARVWIKLIFWASETAFFQSRLAHAGYVAAPAGRWPDAPETPESPAAEAVARR